ncbi:uncharacterized protein BO87DRAFT_377502 [Aspergillus neoniger CBS 115656]|uniref:Uncharacterized protein n=1 Tax=Aspergillus neoniger (strain CBS 115656) TaxID=1448310 RepID=A0A318YLU7_ASPNB|nr:hypothetical protein BO87DRAFT_377502 [Aspergillus neoniger CBS 115656]PYH33340.1 hypothetical protein BO87DRAFT_377502 [Aspergillus neoniger CBS 115656]
MALPLLARKPGGCQTASSVDLPPHINKHHHSIQPSSHQRSSHTPAVIDFERIVTMLACHLVGML